MNQSRLFLLPGHRRFRFQSYREWDPRNGAEIVCMPLLNGLDAAWRIREQVPNIKFVFLVMRDDPNLATAALELGPIGFVLKHSFGPELLEAIGHVLHGKSYLSPKLRTEDWVATMARAR